MIDGISPAWPLVLGALLALMFRGRLRDAISIVAPLASLALVILLPEGEGGRVSWLGLSLVTVSVDPIARVFGAAFGIAALAGSVYALRQQNALERAAALFYAGVALGVVFAGDLVSFTLFFELMAVGSTLVVWSAGERGVALRYAAVHALAGVLMIGGVAAVSSGGTGGFGDIAGAHGFARWLVLAGLLINAGAWPFSFWIPDAYPKASWSGAVFLSAFTTKAAVFGLLRLFPGEPALVVFGALMILYGFVYALLERDMRRLLAYSIVGQVGIMLVAVGVGTELALAGAALHAFAHVVYKAMLMMAFGAVLVERGTARLDAIGNVTRAMPVTMLAAAIGALALAGLPLTSGFVTKSVISDALGEAGAKAVYLFLTASAAGTFVYAFCRPAWFILRAPVPEKRADDPPLSMLAPVVLLAALTLAIGFVPASLTRWIDVAAHVEILTAGHILLQLAVLAGGGIAFLLAARLVRPRAVALPDLDLLLRGDLWRRPAALGERLLKAYRALTEAFERGAARSLAELERQHGPQGLLGRNWPTGSMALSAAILLGLILLLAYI